MTSRLTVGTERIPAKPPRGQPPCTEPYVKGANILADPGVELHIANTGGGPNGVEFPSFYVPVVSKTCPTYTNDSVDCGTAQFVGSYPEWFVGTSDPRTGTYHIQTAEAGVAAAGWGPSSHIFPSVQRACVASNATTSPTTARVEGGDYVRLSFWIKSNYAWWFGCRIRVGKAWTTSDLAYGPGNKVYDDDIQDIPVGTSYTQWTYDFFVPAEGYWLYWQIAPEPDSAIDSSDPPSDAFMVFDDFVLEVT